MEQSDRDKIDLLAGAINKSREKADADSRYLKEKIDFNRIRLDNQREMITERDEYFVSEARFLRYVERQGLRSLIQDVCDVLILAVAIWGVLT